MAISINSLNTSSLPAVRNISPKETSSNSSKDEAEKDVSITGEASEVMADKDDAKLEKIKEEIKNAPVLPSTDDIVLKYGITIEQAQQVLAEVCMELATDAGGTPEQTTKMASNMYLMAELFGKEESEIFDIEKILKGALAQEEIEQNEDEEVLSAQQVADKYDISLEQAQAVLNKLKEENSSSVIASDLSLNSTYSVSGGQVSINKDIPLSLTTVSYCA